MNRDEIKKNRLSNLWRLREKYTLEQIAAKTGTNATYLSQIANQVVQARGKKPRSLSDTYADKIEAGLGLPPGWMDKDHRDAESRNVAEETMAYNRLIPLISWVQAGEWAEAVDYLEPGDAEEWLPAPLAAGPHTFALRVVGDSMTSIQAGQRSYPEGTIIYVDPDKPPYPGKRVIARLTDSNEVTFKVFAEDAGRKFLKPINPQYPIIEINNNCEIIGVVIGSYMPE